MLSMHELSRVYRADTVETTAWTDRLESPRRVRRAWARRAAAIDLLHSSECSFATSGSYVFDGLEVAGLPEGKLANVRKNNIGFIFQSFNLVDELSVRENIELALLYHDVAASERRSRVEAVMDKVGVAHRAKHRPSQLSGGQQQRVAVARALVGNPKLILADEPTGNLDTQHGEEVMKMLQALNREGSTIVMVTHSPAHADYAGRVVNMLDGRILIERRRAA